MSNEVLIDIIKNGCNCNKQCPLNQNNKCFITIPRSVENGEITLKEIQNEFDIRASINNFDGCIFKDYK